MALIKLSSTAWVHADRINSCEIYQQEDNCWNVRWITEDGEFKSDVFTGKVAANNYIKEIDSEIEKYNCPPMIFGEDE
jgi:hypothetical protein